MNGKKEVDVKEEVDIKEESVDEKEMKTDNDDEIKTDNSEEIKEVKEKKTDQPKKDEKSTSFFGMLYKKADFDKITTQFNYVIVILIVFY